MSNKEKHFRQFSKQNFTLPDNQHNPGLENINTGSLQRIADAVEIMAQDSIKLKQELEYYKKLSAERSDKITKLGKDLRYKDGIVTRYKNKSVKLEVDNARLRRMIINLGGSDQL